MSRTMLFLLMMIVLVGMVAGCLQRADIGDDTKTTGEVVESNAE